MKITRRQLRKLIQEQSEEWTPMVLKGRKTPTASVPADVPKKRVSQILGDTDAQKMHVEMFDHIIKNLLDDKQRAELKEWYVNYTIEHVKSKGYSEPTSDMVDQLNRAADMAFKIR